VSGRTVYTYVDNDPYGKTDPTGECAPACTIVVGAIVGGLAGAAIESFKEYKATGSINGVKVLGAAASGAIIGAAAGSGALILAAPLAEAEAGAGAVALGGVGAVGAGAGAFAGALPAAAANAAITGTSMPSSQQLMTQAVAASAGAVVGAAAGGAVLAGVGGKTTESLTSVLSSTAASETTGDATEHVVSSTLEKAAGEK